MDSICKLPFVFLVMNCRTNSRVGPGGDGLARVLANPLWTDSVHAGWAYYGCSKENSP